MRYICIKIKQVSGWTVTISIFYFFWYKLLLVIYYMVGDFLDFCILKALGKYCLAISKFLFQNSVKVILINFSSWQAHTVLEMNYTEQQLTAAVVSDGLRPVLASEELGIPSRLVSMIRKCWDANPKSRPSFDEIVKELDFIMEHRKVKKMEDMHIRPCNLPVDQCVDKTYQESISWSAQGELFARNTSSSTDSGFRTWCESYDKPFAYLPILSWGSYATCGRREAMEDTHFILPHVFNEKDVYAFGIFDGHRGTYDIINI